MHSSRDAGFAPDMVVGVDGCRGDWVVVAARPHHPRDLRVRIAASFAEVGSWIPESGICAVDIPVGLLDIPQPGGRPCDREARKTLGRRTSSVFSLPARSLRAARTYDEVRLHGMSLHGFGILPKVREVDTVMTPRLQERIHEAHPEVAFAELTGAPLLRNKKTEEGRNDRLRALRDGAWVLCEDPEAGLRPAREDAAFGGPTTIVRGP